MTLYATFIFTNGSSKRVEVIADLQIFNSNQSNQNLERLYIRGVVRLFGCTPCLGQEQTRLRPDQTSFCNVLDLTSTMVDLPDTMVDLPNTMVDLANTMVDLSTPW